MDVQGQMAIDLESTDCYVGFIEWCRTESSHLEMS